ncbi:hypothetical protein VE04_10333 [Pseudogymnoascus sp. 24MN13]|nr:hypothetical protein VE04_10333 [Pseudogymnoascus sp. 24MN13]
MTFPLIWPKVPNGPGRILEFSVRRGGDDVVENVLSLSLATEEKQPTNLTPFLQREVTNHHVHRQARSGPDPTQETSAILSLTDLDCDTQLASSEQLASNRETTTHSIDIPEGPATTPVAGWYMVGGMRCPEENKAALAASLDAYLRGIFHCGTFAPVFHHVGVSRTDPAMVLSVQGWPTREAADEYWHSKEHWAFYPAVKDLMVMDLGPFQGALSESK